MHTHPSFQEGLFVPNPERQLLLAPNLGAIAIAEALSPREEDIIARLGARSGNVEATAPFSKFMLDVSSAIIPAELEADAAKPNQERETLQRFFRRVLVAMDGAFDHERSQFTGAMAEGEDAFMAALNSVEITRAGEPFFTAGEAVRAFDKKTADPSLYPSFAQQLVASSVDTFVNTGIKDMGRRDSAHLSAVETQQLKEVTNGLYAQVLFDIAYAPFAQNPAYAHAQDRFVAAKLAYQYQDEVLDIAGDAAEGSANLVMAYAREFNEVEALGKAMRLLSKAETEDTAALTQYYRSIQLAAPRAYDAVATRQKTLLSYAGLPDEVAAKVAL